MLDAVIWTLLIVLGLAVAFDYINGFHDTANAIATSQHARVATEPRHRAERGRQLRRRIIGTAVAATIGAGLIDEGVESQMVVAAALIGAIVWNLFTWRAGLPAQAAMP